MKIGGVKTTPQLILATDLDGTFLGGSDAERRELYDWIMRHRDKVGLIFVTGRDLPFIEELCRTTNAPLPDYVIGDVGTTIATVDPETGKIWPDDVLELSIRRLWDKRGDWVRETLSDAPGLTLQDGAFRYRVSYHLDPSAFDPTCAAPIEAAGLDWLVSADRYFDVLPKGVSKGPSLLRLLKHLDADGARVLVAGDTLNDLSLFETGLLGVAVGNSEAPLLEKIDGRSNVHFATGEGAAGISEAIAAFGFLDDSVSPPSAGRAATSTEPSSPVSSGKSDLVIVYHRQPYEEAIVDGRLVRRENKSPNGIVPTLKGFFGRASVGASWVAWKEAEDTSAPGFDRVIEIEDSYGQYRVSRLPLTKEQVRSFYHVTSKEALWPILHSFKERYNYDPVDWPTFREVNWLFAEAAAAEAADGATVWVHDYNLWLVPAYLRKINPTLKIAFFHHTPFPAADMFNILPWREEIVGSLLDCDVVGFHIPRYTRNFVNVAQSLFDVEIAQQVSTPDDLSASGAALSELKTPVSLTVDGREVRLATSPVGVNVDFIEHQAESEDTEVRQREIASELDGKRLILAISRTDYTKGGVELLQAYERLLQRQPALVGEVRLLLVSVAASTGMKVYAEVQSQIEALAGRINARFSRYAWQPVHLMSTPVPFKDVIPLYRVADVCWVTPLADGLNLVAKEYVAARTDGDGVLVLSEFAGVAVELPDAVRCNPFSKRSMDAAIDRALEMPEEERRMRMTAMAAVNKRHGIKAWSDAMQASFDAVGADSASADGNIVTLAPGPDGALVRSA